MEAIRLLKYIGSAVFVKYYYDFKEKSNEECIALIGEDFTDKSKISRTSKAKRLFREHLNIEALEYIASSKKLDVETVVNAKRILARQNR